MRIAFLTDKYPPAIGGLAVSSERLTRAIAANDIEVHVYTLAAQSSHSERHGIDVHTIGTHAKISDTLADWFNVVIAHHRHQPFDLLHAYFLSQAGFVATYAARYLNIPAIVSARGNDLDRAIFDPGKAAHVLYALHHADAVTTNARDLLRKAQALVPTREVHLIPNGVDATHFTPAPRDETLARSLGIADMPVLGFLGEARAKKGLAPLLLAYRQTAQKRRVALLLIGSVRTGDDADMLKLFQKQNTDLSLIVVPEVTREMLPAYYNLLDVLLIPSLRDGLPNVLLEGMACARAIIGTHAGGIPDVLRDRENGILIPPGDVEALAQAIERMLDHPEGRAQLGQRARDTVLQNFTPQQELDLNLALYEKVLKV